MGGEIVVSVRSFRAELKDLFSETVRIGDREVVINFIRGEIRENSRILTTNFGVPLRPFLPVRVANGVRDGVPDIADYHCGGEVVAKEI